MELIPPLNGAARRRVLTPLLFALGILFSVGLLYGRLTTLYARSTAVPPASPRLPAGFPDPELIVPAGAGFQRLVPGQGLLLIQGPRRLLGQQEVSLCDQRASTSTAATLLPLYVGWDWAQAREAAAANLTAQPPRPAHYGLKNPLLDDGPGGVDVPAFAVTVEPASAPLRPYADAEPLQVTVRDRRPVLLLADTAASGPGPTLAFRHDLWLLWNDDEPSDATHYDHAVRVRRLAERDCAFGRLRVSVYGGLAQGATDADAALRTVWWYPGDGRSTREFHLAPGRYAAPAAPPPRREDAELFDQALAAGLLRPGADGRIAVAPADLPLRRLYASAHPDLLAPRNSDPDWLSGAWDERIRALHRTLHFGASGRYVRQQVEVFNSRQLLAAVRWRPESTATGDWRAEWGGAPLLLTAAMPPLTGRLFTEIPSGWEPWRRVARWPALVGQPPVRFRLTLMRPARRGARLEALAVGAAPTVTGATVLAREPRCLDARPCSDREAAAYWLRLELSEGATGLTLDFQPLPATAFPDAYRHDFAHIQHIGERLVWRDPPATVRAATVHPPPAEVTLRDRAGTVLLERGQSTEAAWTLGLAALVGLDPAHEGAVSGTLARLSDHGVMAVDARLTVDVKVQTAARQALRTRLPALSAAFKSTDPYHAARVASLVVLDADRGEILAAASSPEPSPGAAWSDLYSFAVGQPRRSPLRLWAWQHDGGGLHSAGSAFKLVDALLLEREAATQRPELAAILAGLNGPEWASLPLAQTYDFDADAACYPAHAEGCAPWARRPGGRYDPPTSTAVHNFRGAAGAETLLERMQRYDDDRYGLPQALRDSLNTWFAWLVETSDATLLDDPTAPGLAGVRALTPNALRGARPLLDVAAGLGFGAAQDLDSGLLPAGMIEAGDALRTTAATLDPMTSRTEVRLAALGFRMQVTPLQLAEVAAAIATGRRTVPRLLAELNGRPAHEPEGAALGIATDRIRQGMSLVVSAGTARTAFAAPRFDALRPFLYAKTGTADLDETGAVQNAWLVGWLEPGALPGETRRLAFACLISHTAGTGGEECGPVVADWLAALTAAKNEP